MGNNSRLIPDCEDVIRLLSRAWVNGSSILHVAFTLREHETYISVNRPAVASYNSDVEAFLRVHPDFYSDEKESEYMRALINVGDIRLVEVNDNGTKINVDVEVEPRDVFTKSHAGIIPRYEGKSIQGGDTFNIRYIENEISSDQILLKVRSRLLALAQMEFCQLYSSE